MKKLFCILLTLFMVFALVGCSSSSNEDSGNETSDKVELVIWAHNDQEVWINNYQAIADAFTAENPDITIRFETFPYDEFESKVLTSLTSKSGGADIYEMWGGWGTDYASTGALAALPDAMAQEIFNDAYPSTYGALEYEGKLYGMPQEFNIESGAMLVNNHLVTDAIPTTWDEMIALGKKLTVQENGLTTVEGFDFVNWDGVPYLFTSMILSQGAQYLNEDGTFNFTSPEAIKAFTTLHDLVNVDKVASIEGLTDASGLEGYYQLYADCAAIVPRGPWTIAEGIELYDLVYGTDFSYEAMPWYGSQPAFAAETGWSMAVNSSSAHQEEAFKFLDFFFQDDQILSHNVACGQIPAKKSVAQSAEYLKQFPYAEPLVGILQYGQFIGYFNTDSFKEAINNAFVDYCSGVYATAEEALTALEATLAEI